jgi:hypothetical protein
VEIVGRKFRIFVCEKNVLPTKTIIIGVALYGTDGE